MPTASPFLDDLLTRWTDQRKQVRQVIVDRLDDLLAHRQLLDDGRRANRESRGTDLHTIEQKDREGEGRWIERLRRIEDWKDQVAGLQRTQEEVEKGIAGTAWFERAQGVASRFSRRLERRAARLSEFETTLRQDLEGWTKTMAIKRVELEAFQARQREHETPLLVSHGRKRPEIDFVDEQSAAEGSAAMTLQGLRQAINLHLNRLYRTSKTLETRSSESPAMLELRRSGLMEQLKDVQLSFFALRERVLADVLLLEACRGEFRWIKGAVDGMKCIEDVYRRPEPIWRRLLSALSR